MDKEQAERLIAEVQRLEAILTEFSGELRALKDALPHTKDGKPLTAKQWKIVGLLTGGTDDGTQTT